MFARDLLLLLSYITFGTGFDESDLLKPLDDRTSVFRRTDVLLADNYLFIYLLEIKHLGDLLDWLPNSHAFLRLAVLGKRHLGETHLLLVQGLFDRGQVRELHRPGQISLLVSHDPQCAAIKLLRDL
jgi:hypothetical protein